ncbi:MAG: suppressor of fused domain protein [Kofleriaceae bacterium]
MVDPSEEAPGWDAIDDALAPLYRGVEPLHYGTVVSRELGGEDPIAGISVYLRDEPTPHFHFVTYGFTELWEKESSDEERSGYGFELTFRLAREPDEEEPPAWALHFLQNLGRYVFRTGNVFAPGHKMGLNGPIALEERTAITAICFAQDPELGRFTSRNGQGEFLQVVGITDDEYRLIQDWCTDGLISLLSVRSELLITELWRPSILARPGVLEALQERIDREGSSETSSFAGDLAYDSDGSRVVITLGALYAPAIRRAMLGRIRHRRSYQIMGRTQAVVFEPGSAEWSIVEGRLVLGIPPAIAKSIAAQVNGHAGRYDLPIPGVTLVVAPTYIRDQQGRVVDVKGVDEAEIEELANDENAKLERGLAESAAAAPKRARTVGKPGVTEDTESSAPASSPVKASAEKSAKAPATKAPSKGAKAPAKSAKAPASKGARASAKSAKASASKGAKAPASKGAKASAKSAKASASKGAKAPASKGAKAPAKSAKAPASKGARASAKSAKASAAKAPSKGAKAPAKSAAKPAKASASKGAKASASRAPSKGAKAPAKASKSVAKASKSKASKSKASKSR